MKSVRYQYQIIKGIQKKASLIFDKQFYLLVLRVRVEPGHPSRWDQRLIINLLNKLRNKINGGQ